MKKLALALTALAAFTGSASAADLAARPYTKAAPMPVAVASWTGCYIGGGGGYGLWNQENTGYTDNLAAPGRTQTTQPATAGGRGYFGTVQVGCDYQFALGSWNMVVGAFGDYDWASEKGHLNLPVSVLFGDEKLDSKWAVGGRIGWLVTPQLLTYFSGGYTEAHFNQVNFNGNLTPGTLAYFQGNTYKGYFLGAGDEYALSFLPGLFWKTEYRFSEYDTKTNRLFNATTNLPTVSSYDSQKWDHSVRTELVYRFNWGGAVVAKY
jgi:outer membrane immunogenic protein